MILATAATALDDQFDAGMLVLRACLGLFLAYHGYNKIFGGGGLKGTASWFGGIGFKWPNWQARLAATTEIGAGLLLAVGFLTPLAGAGIIGVMLVAIVVAHWKVGFFVFLPNQGWEYCATIAIGATVRRDRSRWPLGAVRHQQLHEGATDAETCRDGGPRPPEGEVDGVVDRPPSRPHRADRQCADGDGGAVL
ncbi:MAG: DoxX family protein, partial [Actinomycetota bacterium]